MATREKIKAGWNKFKDEANKVKEKVKYNLVNPTKFTKARDKFEKFVNKPSIDRNGYTLEYSASEIVNSIAQNGYFEPFDTLDEIGELLRKSINSRSTSHKIGDYSSKQMDSSGNLQTFDSNMLKEIAKNEAPVDAGDAIYDEKYTKTIADFNKKAQKELDSLIKLINGNKTMKQAVKDKIEEIKNNKSKLNDLEPYLKDMRSIIDDGVNFVDENNKRINGNLDDIGHELSILGAELTPYSLVLFLGGAVAGVPGVVLATGGILLFFALAAIVWALLEGGLMERLGTIAGKRYLIKVKEKVRNITKYTNDIARYNRQYVRNLKRNDDQQEVEVTQEMKNIINDFIFNQKSLWNPYTTVEGRQYKEEMKRDHGYHISGLRKVLDENNTEVRQIKLGLANTWIKMEVNYTE